MSLIKDMLLLREDADKTYPGRFGDVAVTYTTAEGDVVLNFDYDTGKYTLSLHTSDNEVKYYDQNIEEHYSAVASAMKKHGLKVMPESEFNVVDRNVSDFYDEMQDDDTFESEDISEASVGTNVTNVLDTVIRLTKATRDAGVLSKQLEEYTGPGGDAADLLKQANMKLIEASNLIDMIDSIVKDANTPPDDFRDE